MWRAAVSACLPACPDSFRKRASGSLSLWPSCFRRSRKSKKKKDAKAWSGYEPSFQPAEQALEDVVGLLV